MAAMLETPSRIWRRIESVQDREMPSLPSLPSIDDSMDEGPTPSRVIEESEDDLNDSFGDISLPVHSTPAMSNHTAATTIRPPLSAASTARFAHSLASRSSKSSIGPTALRSSQKDSFDITEIPSLSAIPKERSSFGRDYREECNQMDEPDIFIHSRDGDPPGDQDYSISDALQSVSRSSTPPIPLNKGDTPKTAYNYSTSFKSEPKASPFDKYRNVALRKTLARTRTPSLTRTSGSSSQSTSPSASTPSSHRSLNFAPVSPATIALPRSTNSSPAQPQEGGQYGADPEPDRSLESQETGARSMEMTDIHVSPQRLDGVTDDEGDDNGDGAKEYTQGERLPQFNEPTFSSEGDHPSPALSNRTIAPLSMPSPANGSSIAQSFAATPTPAFPRPRARFDLPKPAPLESFQTPAPTPLHDDDDLMTPATRRPSFLLSVINSSTRPRMKLGTPHPRQYIPATPSISESPERQETESPPSTSGSSAPQTSHVSFAAATPRPRLPAARRMSHPLAQATTASPPTSDAESVAGGKLSARAPILKPWATPAQGSPYDGAMDKASFISTASSHDLTTHHRVNTSFDPAMGFGAAGQGHGVGRFNAGKLNNYLHGLNRRLQEENESLLARVRRLEEEKKAELSEVGSNTSRRSSGILRRQSGGSTLGNVQEEGAEAWIEEKVQLEDMVDAFKEEAEKNMVEKEELERELDKEREERKRDQERWKERMGDVEEGVAGIIADLEKKVEAAEAKAEKARETISQEYKDLERALEDAREESDMANERALKAERLLENGKDLGGALNEANERISHIMGDLRNANAHIKDLEEEVARSDQRIDDLEKDLREDKEVISQLEEELHAQTDALDSEHAKVSELEEKVKAMEGEVESARAYIDELEEGAAVAVEEIERLEKETQEAKATVNGAHLAEERAAQTVGDLERDSQRNRDLVTQTREALEVANRKLEDDDDHIADLESKIASLERERDKLHKQMDASLDPSWKPAQSTPVDEEIEILERELDDAHKEIGRLNALLSQSPARKAVDKVKDARIEVLEQEREELLERNKALRMTFNEMATPNKRANNSMISPIHRHVLSMSIKAPRTPGAPLKDLSWLNTTMNDPTVSPLIAEIHRLQHELDVANESIDDKLDKLEDAGLGVVGLTEKLENARAKISRLEDEIGRLSRKDERWSRRLERARCKKCNIKIDVESFAIDESSYELSRDSLPSEPPTPPTRTTEKLRGQLQDANASLERLQREMEDLQASNKRLNSKLKETKEESKRAMESNSAKSGVQIELDKAKRTIADLEDVLSEERSRMRSIAVEQARVEKDKKQVLADLRRAESDMDEVREQLQRLKQENHELEKELRLNSTAEQKARLLETKAAENQDTIAQLRQERNLINKDHKDLQKRYSDLSDTVSRLREKHATRASSHDAWRHKLDLQVQEIEELKQTLDDRDGQLHKVQREKDGVAKNISGLEVDLRRVRKDAEAFGRDLKLLKVEKDKLEIKLREEVSKAERTKKQNQTQIKLLNEQIESQRQRATTALEVYENHVCIADGKQVSDLKLRHNKECKGLMVQIRYLKAKFTRESSFRDDLRWQKGYLMTLLAQFKRSERNISASIAKIGFPVASTPPKRKRSLKSVALAVVFLNRTKEGTTAWQVQLKDRAAVTAALDEVHRRRALAAP